MRKISPKKTKLLSMEGQLIDVLMEDGTDNLAKVVQESKKLLKVRFFSLKECEDKILYKLSKQVDEIDKESVSGYYDTTDETELDMEPYGKNTWVKYLEEDYEPSVSESETDSSDGEDFSDDEL